MAWEITAEQAVQSAARVGLEYDPRELARRVPQSLHGGLRRYVEFGVRPGAGLYAVLTNDLRAAVGQLDATNLPHLASIVGFLKFYVPGSCWGDQTKCEAWIKSGGINGRHPGLLPLSTQAAAS